MGATQSAPVPLTPTPEPLITTPSGITLTMWTTEAFSPLQDDAGSELLKQQIEGFSAENPNIQVEFTLKKAYGKGGISDFLQTTGAVIPAQLPDLAILDIQELPEVAQAGILRPLDGLVSQQLRSDLFPFAAEACTVDEQLMGIQFEADLIHLVYDTEQLKPPPTTWTDVLSGTTQYAFPAGGDLNNRVNDAFWLQYLTLQNAPLDLGDEPTLNRQVVEEILAFWSEGFNQGVIPPTVQDYRTMADAWSAYLRGTVGMVNTNSLLYLNNRAQLRHAASGQVPTRDGKLSSLATGWALVIVATDQARQEAGAKLIDWLMRPENNGSWTYATHRVPTTRQAFNSWDVSDPYVRFLQQLAEVAAPHPAGPSYDFVAEALQRAVHDVLSGSVSPGEAADAAITAIEK